MAKYQDKLNEIFIALYGTDTDEYGEKYKEVYRHEVKGMEKDFYKYIELMRKMSLSVSVDELAKFVVWTELEHIGYSQHKIISDYERLKGIVLELI